MSSTIWNRSPSSSPNARHRACSRSGTSATHSATPTDAANRQPVLSLCSVASSGAVPVMSRYCPCSSGVRASSARYDSARSRNSSGLCIRLRVALRALQLLLDLPAQLCQLGEDVERLVGVLGLRQAFELRARRLEPRQELLRPGQGFLAAAHLGAAFSLTILPSIPFTSLAASSVA